MESLRRMDRRVAMATLASLPWAMGRLLGAAPAGEGDRVEGSLGKRLDEHMGQRASAGWSGALLVAREGTVAIAKGYGQANRQKQIPYTSQTIFDIGSITKQFTGAAIAKLESEGKLSSDDAIGKYFDKVPEDKADITLFHLLTHSAGLKGDFGGDYEAATREWIVEQALQSELLFVPGEGHRYANSGFSLLAAVVEMVSGQPYETYLREQLWLPAGMEQTGYRLPNWDLDAVAHGYRGKKDWGTPLDKHWAADGPYWNLRGNGGVLSNVWDLYRWHQALLGDAILSAEAKGRMFARKVREGPESDSWYSYGWVLTDSAWGRKVIEHNGGNGVFFANLVRYVEDDVVLIVASNRAVDAFGAYVRGIKEVVFG